ncbi:phospholipase A2 inhibitor and Ly6/PLAUR domain-containing protein-like [Ornithorhynchus anatinus]|uniref:phospholipase A2 inhibitor and Ly6/PLAUR domain-containing protein-like n=1 Tax=Ornithorhynchus anatinus TaxID=9258 RepID=UPI0010A8EE43|nr:phospholipase A2 inhibitor and Ly6/PLAUR domain-containing protein-like [Ornithorhynchus anatinus]
MVPLLALSLLVSLAGPAWSLSCFNCSVIGSGNCSGNTNLIPCGNNAGSCLTLLSWVREGHLPLLLNEKRCNADDRLCDGHFSLAAGSFLLNLNTSCCRSDRCNEPEIELQPSVTKLSGFRCPSCFARHADTCSPDSFIACTSPQEYCIRFEVTTAEPGGEKLRLAFSGCASRALCSGGAAALFAAHPGQRSRRFSTPGTPV